MASASVVLTSDTSGSVTVTVPSGTAIGTTTLTLPTSGGTIQTSGSGFTTNGVAYASSTSALTTGSGLVWTGSALGIGTSSPNIGGVARAITLNTASSTNVSYELAINNVLQGSLYTTYGTSAVTLANFSSGPLTFYTGSSEAMRLDSSGTFFVGTTTTSYFGAGAKTNINGGGTCALVTTTSGGAGYAAQYVHNTATTTNNAFISFGTEGTWTERGSITYNRAGGLTVYNTTSDYRSKTVNGLVQNALSKVALLKPSTGRMNDAEYDIDFFVAHELQEVVPSAVTGEKDAVNEDSTPKYQMVDKSALIPLLTAAIQEQQAIIESLKARLDAANL